MPLRKVRNLRALKPGQWARTRIPDYDIWKEGGDWREFRVGAEVEACVCPVYEPLPDSQNGFRWNYLAQVRRIGSKWPTRVLPRGYPIRPSDLGMCEGHNKPFWDSKDYGDYLDGKGTWLYEPACNDPDVCPGADCSFYLCDICGNYVMPWSDDDGNLVCRDCEVAGLVILPEIVDKLEQAREFARQMGLSHQLERQLSQWLGGGTFFGRKSQCILGGDFAPHSFSFCHVILPDPSDENPQRKAGMHGGLIYQGPDAPADGSFPSLTVSLASGTGWFCHT